MGDQVIEEAPKDTKLFPLFYKKPSIAPVDNDRETSSKVRPKAPRRTASKSAASKSSENVREPQKPKKTTSSQSLQKADSDGKLTTLFKRKAAQAAAAPMPLSPTSLNRPQLLDDTTEDEIETLSLPASDDVVPRNSSPVPSSGPDDNSAACSSNAPPSPISVSSADESDILVAPPMLKRARKARQVTPIVIEIEDDGAALGPLPTPFKTLARTETASSVGSRDQPIEIEDSPAKAKVDAKPINPFFARRPAPVASPTRIREVAAAWPSSNVQHVRGDWSHLGAATTPPPARSRCYAPSFDDTAPMAWLNAPSVPAEPSSGGSTSSGQRASSPQSDTSSPAAPRSIHPVFHAKHSASSTATWNDQYRPTSAQHVLGNEQHAHYLRSWLRALQLQITSAPESAPPKSRIRHSRLKRPAVVRSVNPKRKRRRASGSDSDDWIVPEGEEDEEDEDIDDGFQAGRSDDEFEPPVTRGAPDETPNPAGDRTFAKLSNVILLTGPPGVGKSAAAHACAMELGWSVFEIYPGIGKRSGTNIVSLVGDAARNHHLHRGKARDDIPPGDAGLAAEPTPLDGCPAERLSHATEARTVRQSLFLFDEVDILFREDANFWPTLVQLVAESRRPVILTCNDISLVPLEDLPVQTILEFEPCEPELASSYLQHLAHLNGLHLDRGVARSIYARSSSGPARQDCSRGDLRQSINILQFWASLAPASGSREPIAADAVATDWSQASVTAVDAPIIRQHSAHEEARDLLELWRLTELASQFDSHHERLVASIEQTGQPQQEDDVVGRVQLPASDAMDHLVGSGFLDRFESMETAALWAGRHVFESTGAGVRARGSASPSSVRMDWKTLSGDQRWHQMQQAAFLGDIVSSSALKVARREMVLDYVPRIMEMVRHDDVQEAAQTAGVVRTEGRRRVTRARQLQYERYVTLGLSAMAAVRTLGWHVD